MAGFSRRRAQITAELDRLGYTSTKAAAVATLATRPPKGPKVTLADLRAGWAERGGDLGVDGVDHLFGRDRHHPPKTRDLVEAMVAPDGLTAASSGFDRRDVLRALACEHRTGAWAGALRAEADMVLADREVVALARPTPAGGPRYSTRGLLDLEGDLIGRAQARTGAGTAVVPVGALEAALAPRPGLSGEQRSMVARLTRSGAGVEVVVGRAGTGKTFALDAARAAWANNGTPVIGCALSARAAAELQAGSGIPASTIDRLLLDYDRPGPHGGLTAGSVLVIDEAAMVGTRKLGRLLTLAERSQAKIVLVGDPRQLPEIDAGGLFATLARDLPAIELVTNRRQQQPWERDALAELRAGSVPAAVIAYAQHGRIVLTATAEAARERLVGDWWAARQGGAQAAMFAYRRADVDDLNARARQHLRAAGLHGEDTLQVGGRELAVGDDIVCLRNDRRHGVINGTTATVTAINQTDRTITVDTAAEQNLVIGSRYLAAGHVTHGYATTYHKAQGATVQQGFVLGSDALYREAGYTALSRAWQETHLYEVDPTAGKPAGLGGRPATRTWSWRPGSGCPGPS